MISCLLQKRHVGGLRMHSMAHWVLRFTECASLLSSLHSYSSYTVAFKSELHLCIDNDFLSAVGIKQRGLIAVSYGFSDVSMETV